MHFPDMLNILFLLHYRYFKYISKRFFCIKRLVTYNSVTNFTSEINLDALQASF